MERGQTLTMVRKKEKDTPLTGEGGKRETREIRGLLLDAGTKSL